MDSIKEIFKIGFGPSSSHTMKRTGKDLPSLYKETALGGLALDDSEE